MRIRELFFKISWGETDNEFSTPILLESELNELPIKWLKNLLLVRVGLRDINELNKEIYRFKVAVTDIIRAKQRCIDMLNDNVAKLNELMIIIKIVFSNISMGLPNYRVYSVNEVDDVFTNIIASYMGKADEIWLCRSIVSPSGSNFGGRISLRTDIQYLPENLEIIWFTSPRSLDGQDINKFPHLKAFRNPGSLAFHIDIFYIPEKHFEKQNITSVLISDYIFAVSELYRRRENVDLFRNLLQSAGVGELVLEFKVESGRFKFIDWDADL